MPLTRKPLTPKPLTVVQVAFGFAPVTADPAGGAEQVLAQCDRALCAAGHRSIVVACEGSAVTGELAAFPAGAAPATVHAAMRERIAALVASEKPDVVHCHGLDFADHLPPPGPPVLATLHLPLDWYAAGALHPTRPRTYLQPVSVDQAARAPADVALIAAVPNGVDCDLYRPAPKGCDLLVLGRVAPEKGFAPAIDAAKAAGASLVAAGRVFPYPEHQRYFADEVLPRLDGRRRWIGPAEGARKRRLLARARALLLPSTAPETSSLVAMEALASGTPVIAYRSGALPTIVEDGVTGFIVDDVAGMAAAIARLPAIDPAACRQAACDRFPLTRTAQAYLDLYARLAA